MTTYYVRSNGDDGNAGTSAGAAWATVVYAATQVNAGDVVYIGPGTYYGHIEITVDGASGNVIQWIGDFLGIYTGDSFGEVIVSAAPQIYGDQYGQAASTITDSADITLLMDGVIFNEFYNITFASGYNWTLMVRDAAAVGMQGILFQECTFLGSFTIGTEAIDIDLARTTSHSANEGFEFLRCMFAGASLELTADESATEEVDYKSKFEACIFTAASGGTNPIYVARSLNSTYGFTGIDFVNLGIYYSPGLAMYMILSADGPTTEPINIHGCMFKGSRQIHGYTLASMNVDERSEVFGPGNNASLSTSGPQTEWGEERDIYRNEYPMTGYCDDLWMHQIYGWSPVLPYETYVDANVPSIDTIGNTVIEVASEDFFNQGLSGYGAGWWFGFMDGVEIGDAGPPAVWTTPVNAADRDTGTYALYVEVGGNNAHVCGVSGFDAVGIGGYLDNVVGVPEPAFDPVMYFVSNYNVWQEVFGFITSGADQVFWQDAGIAFIHATSPGTTMTHVVFPIVVYLADGAYTYTDWSIARLKGLSARIWVANAGNSYLRGIGIATKWRNGQNVGPVCTRGHAIADAVTVVENNSMELQGKSHWRSVGYRAAGTYTASVSAQYDASYTGTKPTIRVLSPVDAGDDTDVQVGASGSFESLSVQFTLATAQPIQIVLESEDTSGIGKCFFENLTVVSA